MDFTSSFWSCQNVSVSQTLHHQFQALTKLLKHSIEVKKTNVFTDVPLNTSHTQCTTPLIWYVQVKRKVLSRQGNNFFTFIDVENRPRIFFYTLFTLHLFNFKWILLYTLRFHNSFSGNRWTTSLTTATKLF